MIAPDRPWIGDAACAGHPTDWWILDYDARHRRHQPAVAQQIAAAKAICQTCPVITPCADEYLERTETYDHDANAIAGGLTPWERIEIVNWRRRGPA
jgi:hypothetical protein